MSRVFLNEETGEFWFVHNGNVYTVSVIRHEYTLKSVDALQAKLLEVTGSEEYIPEYGWDRVAEEV